LRERVEASIARGGHNTDADVERRIDAVAKELRKAGY